VEEGNEAQRHLSPPLKTRTPSGTTGGENGGGNFSDSLRFIDPGLLLAIAAAGEGGIAETITVGTHFGLPHPGDRPHPCIQVRLCNGIVIVGERRPWGSLSPGRGHMSMARCGLIVNHK
jgi:hypothetical protein